MKIDDKQFEKAIQSKLAGHEADVRSDLWAAIESQLPRNTVAPKVPLYRRIIGYSAAAVAAGVVATVIWWQLPEKPLDSKVVSEVSMPVQTIVEPQANERQQLLTEVVTPSSTTRTVPNRESKGNTTAAQEPTISTSSPTAPETRAEEETAPGFAQASTATPNSMKSEDDYRRKLDEFEQAGRKLKEEGQPTILPSRKKSPGIQVGLMAANATTGKSQNSATAIRTKTPMLLSRRNPVYHFDHKMPISAGVTVAKTLPRNWELESGVVYTYLYSKYSSTNGNGSQELHYLGIPLNVIYRFARIKRLSFYASAGGQVDFYLAGRQKDEGYDEGISGSGYKELKHENVQFSVQANVGAALTLYKQTELYLEPYMAYYFENNSSIHNIWKDKPFNFGLTLGVRTGF